MFVQKKDLTIHCTRGDCGSFTVGGVTVGGEVYVFQPGDYVRFKVFRKNDCSAVVLCKDVRVLNEAPEVDIYLTGAQTKIGEIINRPVDYWYEIELNPQTNPTTVIGYDGEGPKIFRLYPEGADAPETEDGELPEEQLCDLVADALMRAKSSGIFDGTDGEDGKDGADGADGMDGYTPIKGKDYFTEADKAEMVQAVLAAMPQYNGETEDIA